MHFQGQRTLLHKRDQTYFPLYKTNNVKSEKQNLELVFSVLGSDPVFRQHLKKTISICSSSISLTPASFRLPNFWISSELDSEWINCISQQINSFEADCLSRRKTPLQARCWRLWAVCLGFLFYSKSLDSGHCLWRGDVSLIPHFLGDVTAVTRRSL